LIEFCGINNVHISRIDLNLLAIFDTIYAEGSITRASRRLNLSQPAISHALGRLRQLIDDPLFTRRGRLMTPTPLARRMIEPIRQSLQTIEATLTNRDPFTPATAVKHFTVGMRDVLEAAVLGALMRNVAAAASGITISSVRAERRELERELSAGTLDAAIDVLLPLPEEVRRERLGTEWLAVMARRRHPNVGARLTLQTYLAQEHISVSSRRRGLSAEDFELARHNLRRRIRLRCQSYLAACGVVSETDLLLTMPQRYARILNAQFRNQLVTFPLKVPAFDTYLYWHANADSDPANAWLRQQLISVLRTSRPGRRSPSEHQVNTAERSEDGFGRASARSHWPPPLKRKPA
jgi:DNA-binding transcriptional LysR family regulator